MSFTNPQGTRGGRYPGGAVVRFFNKLASRRARKSDRKQMGMDLLVLTTVGAKSGQPRETPLAWFPGENGVRYVVASANGAQRNPSWYYNLAAHPDEVTVEHAGAKSQVTAEQLHGDERAEVWGSIKAAASNFADYEKKTDREIPVIKLTPR